MTLKGPLLIAWLAASWIISALVIRQLLHVSFTAAATAFAIAVTVMIGSIRIIELAAALREALF